MSWPSGNYALFAAKKDGAEGRAEVCPQETGFQWYDGSVTDRNQRILTSNNKDLIGIKEELTRSGKLDVGLKFGFCSKLKDTDSEYFSPEWPKGRYCIVRKSAGKTKCPNSKLIKFSFPIGRCT